MPAIEKIILEQQHNFEQMFVAYGDCGTGGQLDKLLSSYNIARLPGDHCYSFFAGREIFDQMADDELGTFYLTDYLVDNFQRLILDGLGIRQHPELRDQYFSNYTRLMYLRQANSNGKSTIRLQKAQAAADALALPLAVHDTGLRPFEHALRSIQVGKPG